jgi:hypothetical protein
MIGKIAAVAGLARTWQRCLKRKKGRHAPAFFQYFQILFSVSYALAAAAATAAAAAAPAFLRRPPRRDLFNGFSGASPISSAIQMLVTNFFKPWSSKSIEVRSEFDSVTTPIP